MILKGQNYDSVLSFFLGIILVMEGLLFMKKISVEEFVDNFFEKIPDVHDVNYMNYNIFTMICNTVEMIEDQDYLKELLFYSKLTEKYYYPDNYDVYYFSAEKNFKAENASKFPTDKYYFFRQAIALKKEVSPEILCEDKILMYY